MNTTMQEAWDNVTNSLDALESMVSNLEAKGSHATETLTLAKYKLSRIQAMVDSLSTEIDDIIGG